jgi:hypothetical protein
MTLTSLWIEQRNQLEGKNIWQIMSFAGDGKLRDGNTTSSEFREFLSHIQSGQLKQYLDECINNKFDDNGYVLQDIVNQIGRRLGFKVTDGRYRGKSGQIGYDGLWEFPDGHTVVIEVKTTDAYQINLETIARYRREIIEQKETNEESSSILIVIGREDRDTSDLEAQIRGSRYAWNIRLISVDALIRLMTLKEEVEDPKIIHRISAILIPREFTKLDEIINMVFAAAEDVKEETPIDQEGDIIEEPELTKVKPVSFHAACIDRIEKYVQQPLVKRSRITYSTADETIRVTCSVSKTYTKGGQIQYWFAFHPHQKEFLEAAQKGYAAFGCGTEGMIILIPFQEFSQWLDCMLTTEDERRFYWHVYIVKDNGSLTLYRKKGTSRIQLDKFLLPN